MLFPALHAYLAPVVPLYFQALPESNRGASVVAAVTFTPGAGSERQLGDENDGILWYHTGVLFTARSSTPEYNLQTEQVLESIRNRMERLVNHGGIESPTPTQINDDYSDWTTRYGITAVEPETLYWAETTNSPNFLEHDPTERTIMQLLMEVWHSPTSRPVL